MGMDADNYHSRCGFLAHFWDRIELFCYLSILNMQLELSNVFRCRYSYENKVMMQCRCLK